MPPSPKGCGLEDRADAQTSFYRQATDNLQTHAAQHRKYFPSFIRIVREPQLLRLYVTSEGTPQDPYFYVDLIRLEEQQVGVVWLPRTGSLY